MADENTITLVNEILEQIGTMANALSTGLVDLNCNPEDAARGYAYIYSTMAERIGWLADLGLTHTTGSPDIAGGAEDWFMPPSYQSAKRKTPTVGGHS